MSSQQRENWMSSMPGRSTWTKAMLERLRSLAQQGMNEHGILLCLREEFGAPELVGEVKAELKMLQSGPCARQWNPAMEARLKEYAARGMDTNDITNELFNEFAKPESGYWQETYKKIQQMKLKGEIA